jgi:hypothetical protein
LVGKIESNVNEAPSDATEVTKRRKEVKPPHVAEGSCLGSLFENEKVLGMAMGAGKLGREVTT